MVKSVLGVNYQGLRDWLIQRVSAILMVIYVVGMILFLFMHPHFSYEDWQSLFAHSSVKIFSLLVILALLYHTWVGMWTVFTDYIKYFPLRLILQMFIILALIACFFAAFSILWGV